MVDIGFIPGFIGVGIKNAVDQILCHINIVVCCKKDLSTLQDVVREIEPIITHIQQYCLQINRKRGIFSFIVTIMFQ